MWSYETGDAVSVNRGLAMAVCFLLLRCWVGLAGIVAVVNALQCFFDPKYTSRRLYTLDPQQVESAAV